ncbi:hypothetical protein K469DRAFT_290613 [Zopfia rhizophila CBS 207.26]|uniref:Uncharacterized protein n=1 Tax=Zopfia rhizophila CBS 207.26 TaxID=1314779 RepID=A0A6A6DL11_9PEZI|nr:hypothetical protein K469DRAFT_290613 [Zopfia rhizophila CBS 207.26]
MERSFRARPGCYFSRSRTPHPAVSSPSLAASQQRQISQGRTLRAPRTKRTPRLRSRCLVQVLVENLTCSDLRCHGASWPSDISSGCHLRLIHLDVPFVMWTHLQPHLMTARTRCKAGRGYSSPSGDVPEHRGPLGARAAARLAAGSADMGAALYRPPAIRLQQPKTDRRKGSGLCCATTTRYSPHLNRRTQALLGCGVSLSLQIMLHDDPTQLRRGMHAR